MATFAANDFLVIINGVTLSDHAFNVETTDDRNQLTATTFGAGANIYRKGLGDASITIQFYQDFAGGSVYATLQPLIASTTPFQVEVRPTSAGRGATNPGIVIAQALLFSFAPLTGTVGEMVTFTATFMNAGNAGMTYPTV